MLLERNRMAREIHDTLAQSLTGIVLQLEAAEDILPANLKVASGHLNQARRLARQSLEEARRSVWALRPQGLESGDLPSALKRLSERFAERSRTKMEFTLEGTPRSLPSGAEDHLFRIGQEAVTNALKHARAKRIRLELRYEPEKVSLLMEDDGKGFEPGVPGDPRGFGLVSMHERSKRIGASVTIHSTLGLGTRVMAELPVPTGGLDNVPNKEGEAD